MKPLARTSRLVVPTLSSILMLLPTPSNSQTAQGSFTPPQKVAPLSNTQDATRVGDPGSGFGDGGTASKERILHCKCHGRLNCSFSVPFQFIDTWVFSEPSVSYRMDGDAVFPSRGTILMVTHQQPARVKTDLGKIEIPPATVCLVGTTSRNGAAIVRIANLIGENVVISTWGSELADSLTVPARQELCLSTGAEPIDIEKEMYLRHVNRRLIRESIVSGLRVQLNSINAKLIAVDELPCCEPPYGTPRARKVIDTIFKAIENQTGL
jgi:hypothetical protein